MEDTQEHRRERSKTPEHLSIEMILRKSIYESLIEYLNNCSLAGARQMCDPKIGYFMRALWIAVFCTALGTISYFLHYIWSDTLTKPFIVTMESSTYPIGSISFPAIAICNINRISKKALLKFALDEYPDLAEKESLEDLEKMLLNWGRLINYSYNESLRNNPLFNRMVEKYRHDDQRIVHIMKMLAPSCEDMLVKCAWGGALVDCDRIFSMRRIANRGHCCAFNYWAKRLTAHARTEVKRQTEPGYLYGLNVILDPLISDYAYPLNTIKGFDVLILDPSHYADPHAGRVSQRICEPNMGVFLELKSTKQVATKEVRKYGIETRKCIFHDEYGDEFDTYSYSTCIVLCRVSTIHSLCKCTPYFFATKEMQQGPVCTLENLRCLNKYREKFFYLYPINALEHRGLEQEIQDSIFCPECLPDCELTQYFTKSFEVPLSTTYYSEKSSFSSLLNNVNATDKCFLSIYHPLPDAYLDRLDVVFYWYEILSNIGGFSGIIIGFSVISAIEILYFLTIRLVRNFYVNYQKYY